jgi:hypothetical protein
MRLFAVACAVLFVSTLAIGQTTQIHGYTGYGYGPYVPLVTTPEISLQQMSTMPTAGASNATGGLATGARNSTMELTSGNVSATYTQPVWYSGGTTPLISSPSVQLPVSTEKMPMQMMHMEMEMRHEHAEGGKLWAFYSEAETTGLVQAAASAKGGRRATRTITNQDIDQVNQKTGMVKYDGKTETIK